MATASSSPQRVAETIFRRNMLGPTFGHMASSVTGLLLVEKLAMDYGLPQLAPTLTAMESDFGRTRFLGVTLTLGATVAYWGIGGLLAIPAILHMKCWKIQVRRSLDFKALLSAVPLVLFNFVVGNVFYLLVLLAGLPESAFDWAVPPSTGTLARDVVVWLLLQEVSFFYIHRFFHENKRAYALVHKLHHTWNAPVSLVAIFCHPVEHIVANIVPLMLGPLLCGSHLASISVLLFLSLIHTTAVHSGYWICDDNGMHDEHHAKLTVNYGVTGLMDSWYGTYRLPAGAVGTQLSHNVADKSQ